MIEGIRIELNTDELCKHLLGRVKFHHDKGQWYANHAQELKDAGSEGKSNDPAASLRQSANTHADREAFFQFIADHLIPNEVYRLSESDFTRLEFAARFF
jgi:hypothetical protein